LIPLYKRGKFVRLLKSWHPASFSLCKGRREKDFELYVQCLDSLSFYKTEHVPHSGKSLVSSGLMGNDQTYEGEA
jgi:hypothetical protein